jgi:hypothetical protein
MIALPGISIGRLFGRADKAGIEKPASSGSCSATFLSKRQSARNDHIGIEPKN